MGPSTTAAAAPDAIICARAAAIGKTAVKLRLKVTMVVCDETTYTQVSIHLCSRLDGVGRSHTNKNNSNQKITNMILSFTIVPRVTLVSEIPD